MEASPSSATLPNSSAGLTCSTLDQVTQEKAEARVGEHEPASPAAGKSIFKSRDPSETVVAYSSRLLTSRTEP